MTCFLFDNHTLSMAQPRITPSHFFLITFGSGFGSDTVGSSSANVPSQASRLCWFAIFLLSKNRYSNETTVSDEKPFFCRIFRRHVFSVLHAQWCVWWVQITLYSDWSHDKVRSHLIILIKAYKYKKHILYLDLLYLDLFLDLFTLSEWSHLCDGKCWIVPKE